MKYVLEYHNKLIQEHGVSNATGFSYNGQMERFHVIREMIPWQWCPTIFDFGCNKGDFLQYMNLGDQRRYFGCDINPNFIEIAKIRFPHANFLCLDILQGFNDVTFDCVVASGVFCYKNGWDAKTTNIRILKKLWSLTGRVLVFNMLKFGSTAEGKNLTYKTSEACEICELLDCKNYSIIQGYLPNDFTVVMRR